jgi:chromosomal replication initiation ATPase DnaA
VVLGEEDFVERVKGKIKSQGSKREQPSIRVFEAKPPVTVLREVLRYFGLAEKKLSGKRTGYRDERAVAMELMYRYREVSQAEIGKMLGRLDYTSVSRERKRLRERVETDTVLRKALGKIETKLLS